MYQKTMNNINILNRLFLRSSILSMHKEDNSVMVVTQKYEIFKIKDNNIVDVFTLNVDSNLHKYSKAATINSQFAFIGENNLGHVIRLIDKAKFSFKIHNSDISACEFSPDGKYLLTGGEDGRAYIHDTLNFRNIISVPYRPDYISFISFSSDSRFCLVSCFNKSNIIFDIQRMKTIIIFNTSHVVEWGEFFENNTKAYLILRNGNSIIFDVKQNQTLSISNPFISWPSTFYLDKERYIAIVGERNSNIYIIDIKNNTKLFSIDLENIPGVSTIYIHSNCIFIGCVDGSLFIISYDDKNDEFKLACQKKDYKKAASMLEANIFLSLQESAKIFDEDWEDVLKEATNLLALNKIEEALNLVDPFIRDVAKKEAFDFYLKEKDVIKKFEEVAKKNLYEEAYNMTLQIKFLTKTKTYDYLEGNWNKAFNNAKKILEEDIANVNAAKNILDPFLKTPKKELIMQVINNLNVFKDSEILVKQQNFKEYFALCSKFSFLKTIDLYKKVLLLGGNLLDKALEYEKNEDYDEFYKIAKFLKNFPSYKDAITKQIIFVDKKIELINYIRQKNIHAAYNLAIEYDELQYIDEFKNLCLDFEKVYKKGLDLAFIGDASKLKTNFANYININYWYSKILSVFKIAYLCEFNREMKMAKSSFDWQKCIRNYIDIFEKDDEIITFIDENKIQFNEEINEDEEKMIFTFQDTLLVRK